MSVRHGTKTGYNRGCRLDCCRRANMVALKQWRLGQRPKLIEPTGTKRRIRALLALGWTYLDIAEAAGGYTKNWTAEILKQPRVTETTAAKIGRVYEQWSMTIPVGPWRDRGRKLAAARGCLPPLAYDDIDTDPEPTNWQYQPATRHETFAELVDRGAGVSEVCRVLKLSAEALEKWCDRHELRAEFNTIKGRETPHVERRNQWSAAS